MYPLKFSFWVLYIEYYTLHPLYNYYGIKIKDWIIRIAKLSNTSKKKNFHTLHFPNISSVHQATQSHEYPFGPLTILAPQWHLITHNVQPVLAISTQCPKYNKMNKNF
jgi:hypothetical protein